MSEQPLVVEAWQALCGDGAALPAPLTFTADEAVLASVFPVTRLGAAAVLASLLAASHLQAVRTAAPPAPVELDAAHLACALPRLAHRADQHVTRRSVMWTGLPEEMLMRRTGQ